jgi:hypothetical protein
MKPRFANSKSLYRIAVAGGTYHPDLVFATKEDAQKFAESKLSSNVVSIEPVNIVIGLEEDETDRLVAEKKTLEAKLAEVNKKLKNNIQSQTSSFDDFIRAFIMR